MTSSGHALSPKLLTRDDGTFVPAALEVTTLTLVLIGSADAHHCPRRFQRARVIETPRVRRVLQVLYLESLESVVVVGQIGADVAIGVRNRDVGAVPELLIIRSCPRARVRGQVVPSEDPTARLQALRNLEPHGVLVHCPRADIEIGFGVARQHWTVITFGDVKSSFQV